METTGYDRPIPFKESQIICLEYDTTRLYGEVIQLILDRGMCWFRPICMTISNAESDLDSEQYSLIHLRSGSDLLWPTTLFRPALDTEGISLLVDVDDNNKLKQDKNSCRQHLNQFVRQVWAANQDKF